jgi:hypothetical protein
VYIEKEEEEEEEEVPKGKTWSDDAGVPMHALQASECGAKAASA